MKKFDRSIPSSMRKGPRFLSWRRAAPSLLGLTLTLLIGCQQGVAPLKLSDPRLPAAARQRIADAEDAVEVTLGDLEEARRGLSLAVARQIRAEENPPALGAAASAFSGLQTQRVLRAEAEFILAEAELQLAEARLQLVYAESALRYDLAVHPLEPLRQAVDRTRERALTARAAQLQSKQSWQQALDVWWTSYQGTGAEARRAYWRGELVP
ncbi:MAG: hypothetical protein VYD19_06535 [Myxococcota bacterium]|nr:hypothetical protein [Myxococcota bacterium]